MTDSQYVVHQITITPQRNALRVDYRESGYGLPVRADYFHQPSWIIRFSLERNGDVFVTMALIEQQPYVRTTNDSNPYIIPLLLTFNVYFEISFLLVHYFIPKYRQIHRKTFPHA